MAKSFFQKLQSTKARTLILLVGFVVAVVVIILVFFTGGSDQLGSQQSKTAAPPVISSIPGAVTSEKYQALQEEENVKRAEQATKAGTSAIPTIIGSRSKDALAQRETFGIEGELIAGECKCPPKKPGTTGALDPALAAQLISQIEKDPSKALALLKANPGLAKAMCGQKPDLALQIAQQNEETAKIFLKECPEMAKRLAEANPELFKKVMLADPELARQLAEQNPDLFKKLMLEDPAFANALAKSNPELVKTLLKDDPDFADALGKQNPELIKELMKNDPEFARIMAKNNPALVKKLMLDDPEFARLMAKNNPEMVKELMRNDPDFARALAKANPTLVKQLMKNDPAFAKEMAELAPDMVNQLMADDPEFAKFMNNLQKTAAKPPVTVVVEKPKPPSEADLARQAQLNDLQQKLVAQLLSDMQGQATAIMTAWNETTTQQFIEGEWRQKEEEAKDKAGAGGPGAVVVSGVPVTPPEPERALIKAGTILFAVLETSVNTDEPGPVLATVVSGAYKGAKLLGTLQVANIPGSGMRPEKVTLTFNQMNIPAMPKTISVNAVAIDPETARTALASDVDHHYLLRYGSTFASSFLIGYSKVIMSAGTVQQTATNGQSVTTTTPDLSPKEKLYAALGEVGKTWGQQFAQYLNRPNTITVDSGTGVGILFVSDVSGSS